MNLFAVRRTLPPLLSILLPFVLLAQPTFQRIVRSDFGQARAIDRNGSGELYVAARHTDSTTLVNAVQLIKYDPTGALAWGKLITEPDPGSLFQASAIVSTADGGVVVTGHHVVGASADSTFVIKFDGLGNVLWSARFLANAPNSTVCKAIRVEEAPNGDIVVGGEVSQSLTPGGHELFLTRMSGLGAVLWTERIAPPLDGQTEHFGDLVLPSTGGIVLTAQSFQETAGPWLAKLDDAGVLLWAKRYDSGNPLLDLRPLRLFETTGGYDIFLRKPFGGFGFRFYRVRTDAVGGMVSAQRFRALSDEIGTLLNDVIATGFGYMLAGNRSGIDAAEAFLLAMDTSGTPQWGMAYGGSGFETGHAVTATFDGGYLLGGFGETDSLLLERGVPVQETYLVKTDDNGHSSGCETPLTFLDSVASFVHDAYTRTTSYTSGWTAATFDINDAYEEIAVCPDLRVDGIAPAHTFLAYPNPTHGPVLITLLDRTGTWTLRVLDAIGRPVLQSRVADRSQLNLSHLIPGRYVIEVRSAGRTERQQLLKE